MLKSIEEVINLHTFEAIDSRDLNRFINYLRPEHVNLLTKIKSKGLSYSGKLESETIDKISEFITKGETTKQYTYEFILKELIDDLKFAIEKAEAERGISSQCMFQVIRMYMCILNNEKLYDNADEYNYNYGMPYYIKVKKYYKRQCKELNSSSSSSNEEESSDLVLIE